MHINYISYMHIHTIFFHNYGLVQLRATRPHNDETRSRATLNSFNRFIHLNALRGKLMHVVHFILKIYRQLGDEI